MTDGQLQWVNTMKSMVSQKAQPGPSPKPAPYNPSPYPYQVSQKA